MKIVLDTNVLVSGLLTPFGPSGEIVRMISAGELILHVDARILSEYQEVLNRPKFQFDKDHVRGMAERRFCVKIGVGCAGDGKMEGGMRKWDCGKREKVRGREWTRSAKFKLILTIARFRL